MHPRRKSEMELIHLILPIVGAFLLLFIVCCCGKKVKEVLHIPKEVVMGRYVLSAQLRESRQNRSEYELAPQSRTSERISGDIESSTSCVHEEEVPPKAKPASFEEDCCDFGEITEIKLDSTPHVSHARGASRASERDSGVYSLLNNSVGSVSTQSSRRQHHSSSSAASDSTGHHERMRHCSARSETSVIVNVRKASSNNDEEFTIEDGGVCIIHQHTPAELYTDSDLPSPPTEDEASPINDECCGDMPVVETLTVPTLASLASNCTRIHSDCSASATTDLPYTSDSNNTDTELVNVDDTLQSLPSTTAISHNLRPPDELSPVEPRQSCLHNSEDGRKAANQNRVTFSDSKLQSIESHDSNESVFIS